MNFKDLYENLNSSYYFKKMFELVNEKDKL